MDDKAQNELLDVLLAHKGLVFISGYDSDLYNDRLQNWHKEETTCYSQVCSKKREILWMNFEPEEQQMTLKDYIKHRKEPKLPGNKLQRLPEKKYERYGKP